jgi:hypothetical protein
MTATASRRWRALVIFSKHLLQNIHLQVVRAGCPLGKALEACMFILQVLQPLDIGDL